MTDAMPTATLRSTEILARTSFSTLSRSVVDYRRRDGRRQEFLREAYDHGDGAAILLHDPGRGCVLLIRQWRFGAHLNPQEARDGADRGWLIEVPAGLVDGRDPEIAVRAEAMEEAGVNVGRAVHVLDCYMSPGSMTEKVSLFVGTYRTADRTGRGGGLVAEGEDIEIIEPTLTEALAMVSAGKIVDAKTVLLLYHLNQFGDGGDAGDLQRVDADLREP